MRGIVSIYIGVTLVDGTGVHDYSPCHHCLHPCRHIISNVGDSVALGPGLPLVHYGPEIQAHPLRSRIFGGLLSCWATRQECCGWKGQGHCWLVCGLAWTGIGVFVEMVFDAVVLVSLGSPRCLGYAKLVVAAAVAVSVERSGKGHCCRSWRGYGPISSVEVYQRFVES